MFRIALLLIAIAAGCRVSGDTDQSTTLSTSDYPPGKGKLINARSLTSSTSIQVPKGTSDTSTNSGTYNTGRSTTRTVARTTTF